MNPLAWKQCAPRLVMAVAATATLLVAVGCGNSGGIIHPLPGGFSKASLNGQYVIAQTGIGVNQAGACCDPFSETVVFTADGNGNLTIPVDDFNQSGIAYTLPSSLTGIYSLGNDGTGSLSFNGSNYAITMIDDSHFYVIEQDLFATASGFGEKQDTTAFTAAPSGAFAFKAHNLNLSSRVGGIIISGGTISGTEDFLGLGAPSLSRSIATSAAMSAPSSTTGRGTFTLNDGTSFNYYVVNSSKFRLMSSTGELEIGQAEAQTGRPFSVATLAPGTSYVFGSSGDTSTSGTAGIHSAGVFTTDGNGNITDGAVDYVEDTTVNSDLAVSGGSYTLAANGRGQINLTLSGGTISPQIFWMVDGTRAYFLADSTAAVEDGTFSLQQGAPFTAIGNQAAFVMDGFDVAYKDRVGAFQPTSSGAFKWKQTANSFDVTFGGNPSTLATTGTYQVSANGRAAVAVNGGVTSSLVFYLSGPGSGFMVQEDADIGGEFSQQASQ